MKWRRKKDPETAPKTLADLMDENGVIRLGGKGGGRGEAGQPGKSAHLEVGADGKTRFTIDESGGGRGGSA